MSYLFEPYNSVMLNMRNARQMLKKTETVSDPLLFEVAAIKIPQSPWNLEMNVMFQ